MPEQLDDIVDNLMQRSAWLRILFMLAFATVLYFIITPLILVLMLAQALFSVITGDGNNNLRYLGATLAKYVFQILEFITHKSEVKPFPFSDFPDIESEPIRSDIAEKTRTSSDKPSKPVTKQTTRGKTSTKKPISKKIKSNDSDGASTD